MGSGDRVQTIAFAKGTCGRRRSGRLDICDNGVLRLGCLRESPWGGRASNEAIGMTSCPTQLKPW